MLEYDGPVVTKGLSRVMRELQYLRESRKRRAAIRFLGPMRDILTVGGVMQIGGKLFSV